MNKVKKVVNFVAAVYREKCPNCGKGHVFEEKTAFLNIPKMNDRCSACDYRFEREPGYFIGAMYLGYALSIFQGLITYFLCHFFLPEIAIGWVILLVIVPMLFLVKKNFKWSRILYIHIFPW